jgi:putative effector of murein hydrolase
MLDQLFAILLTLFGYGIATLVANRFPRTQPLVVATAAVWFLWWLTSGDWEAYHSGGEWITFWLGPATVALAVPLAKQMRSFLHIWRGVLLGVAAGCAASILSVYLVFALIGMDDLLVRSMLSKSVTTPISVALTENLGGVPALAALFTALTGIIGISLARPLLQWAGVRDDWAIGIAVGTSSHAIGTASLHRVSPVQTAASSVAMIVAGVVTSLYLIPFSL